MNLCFSPFNYSASYQTILFHALKEVFHDVPGELFSKTKEKLLDNGQEDNFPKKEEDHIAAGSSFACFSRTS